MAYLELTFKTELQRELITIDVDHTISRCIVALPERTAPEESLCMDPSPTPCLSSPTQTSPCHGKVTRRTLDRAWAPSKLFQSVLLRRWSRMDVQCWVPASLERSVEPFLLATTPKRARDLWMVTVLRTSTCIVCVLSLNDSSVWLMDIQLNYNK